MNFVRLTLLRVAAVVALACCTGLVHAAELTGDAQGTGPQDAIRLLVEREMGPGHRVDVRVGQLDPRLQLQSCARIEPYLPPGTRLWGRTSIGVRCLHLALRQAHPQVRLPAGGLFSQPGNYSLGARLKHGCALLIPGLEGKFHLLPGLSHPNPNFIAID